MSFEMDNDCVGCERCVHCGRGDFVFVSCDGCGDSGMDNEFFFEYNGKHYCPTCFQETLREEGTLCETYSDEIADRDDKRCELCEKVCDSDEETYYLVDGKLVCEDCLEDYLKDTYEGGTAKELIEAKYDKPDWA